MEKNKQKNRFKKSILSINQKILFSFLLVFIFGFGFSAKASAATYYMRSDGTVTAVNKANATSCSSTSTTLNLAQMKAATYNSGDVVMVCSPGDAPGAAVYTALLSSPSDGLVIQASNWVAGTHPASSAMPSFQNSGADGYAVLIHKNNLTLRGLRVSGQTTSNYYGISMYANKTGGVIEDCLIDGNFRGVDTRGSATIRRNRFEYNLNSHIYSNGIASTYAITAYDNLFTLNSSSAGVTGTAIYLGGTFSGSIYFYNNTVLGASTGIIIPSSSSAENVVIENNLFAGMTGGYAISIGTSVTISGTKLVDYNFITGGGDHSSAIFAARYINFGTSGFDGGHNILGTSWPGLISLAENYGNISFDDAGNEDGQFPQIVTMLNYMNTKNIPATWSIDFLNVGNTPSANGCNATGTGTTNCDWTTSWNTIYAMHQAGHEIGCHSLSHFTFNATNMAQLFKFNRTGGTNPNVVIAYTDSPTDNNGTITFYNNSISEGVITFTAPSDASLLANTNINNVGWLKTQLPANWTIGSDAYTPPTSGVHNSMLLVELAAGTYNSGTWVTSRVGTYSAGVPDTTAGVYYWEIYKAKDILQQKMVNLGATGWTAKTFAWPAWISTTAAQAAVQASGFTSARGTYDNGTDQYKLNGYTAFHVGIQFDPADLWNSGLDLARVRGYAAQAMANYRVFSTMFHGYSQFNASGTLTDFKNFLNEAIADGVIFHKMHDTIDRIVADTTTWTTPDTGNTYNFNTGVVPPNLTNAALLSSSIAINAGTTIAGLTSDYAGNLVPSGLLPDIGAYEYQDVTAPTGGSFNINNDAVHTNSTSATLNITCPTDSWTPIQMAFGDTTNPTNWEACATSKAWTLPGGDGTKTVHMRFRDGGNNMTSDTTDTIILDTTPPTVLDITSTTTNGSYKAGQTINVRATFSENVNITGTPRIKIQTNNGNKYATYSGGTGTSNIDFTYIVQAGDTTSDLDYVDTASLELNSGTIKDAATNDATLTLFAPGAAHSLGDNRNIILDTTAPTITINSPSADLAQSKTITASATESATLSYHINNSGVDTCDSGLSFTAYSSLTFSSESDNNKKVCYKAEDTVGNISYSLSDAISGIDTHAPTISDLSPNNQTFSNTTTSTNLTLTTTETAICKYFTTSGTDYTSMTNFNTTSATNHSTFISGLSIGTTYNYYIKCQDTATNESSEEHITFSVAPLENNNISLNNIKIKIGREISKFKDKIYSSEQKLKLKNEDSDLANGRVEIYKGDKLQDSISADINGAWEKTMKLKDDFSGWIEVRQYDQFGTLLATSRNKVYIDTEKPEFEKEIASQMTISRNQKIDFTAKDNDEIDHYQVKLADIRGWRNQNDDFYQIPDAVPSGTYDLFIRAYDRSGNYAEEKTTLNFAPYKHSVSLASVSLSPQSNPDTNNQIQPQTQNQTNKNTDRNTDTTPSSSNTNNSQPPTQSKTSHWWNPFSWF